VLLQAFTFAQLGIPSAALITLLGAVRGTWASGPRVLPPLARAYRQGRQAAPFLTFYWEEHWAEPVARLRERLSCAPA
jgi:ubiquinone biosynthesis protein Coq4